MVIYLLICLCYVLLFLIYWYYLFVCRVSRGPKPPIVAGSRAQKIPGELRGTGVARAGNPWLESGIWQFSWFSKSLDCFKTKFSNSHHSFKANFSISFEHFKARFSNSLVYIGAKISKFLACFKAKISNSFVPLKAWFPIFLATKPSNLPTASKPV